MWKEIKKEKPTHTGFINCFGTVNVGTDFECRGIFTAFYNGDSFTDRDGEDLIGINECVECWFDFSQVNNPK